MFVVRALHVIPVQLRLTRMLWAAWDNVDLYVQAWKENSLKWEQVKSHFDSPKTQKPKYFKVNVCILNILYLCVA